MTSAEERGGPLGVLRCLFDNDRMELAGLEPATSWVRSTSSAGAQITDLQEIHDALATLQTAWIAGDMRRFSRSQALFATSA
jgi:hypothetical protein